MSYRSPRAVRMALERRLNDRAQASTVSIDRLRRRVVFERVVTRLHAGEPGLWVIKGGMALEMRLHDDARLTKDLDLGMRALVGGPGSLRERLIEALSVDEDRDGFVLTPGPVAKLIEHEQGGSTWRTKVTASLDGRPFGALQLDISPRPHELIATDVIPLPNSLAFAGVTTPEVEVVSVARHAAEKFHGMLKQFDGRENTRVRDLVDLVLLHRHDMLRAEQIAPAVRAVWAERAAIPPARLPRLPEPWIGRYERLAAEQRLATSFTDAVELVSTLWGEMFPDGAGD
jgi:hypothetical protein